MAIPSELKRGRAELRMLIDKSGEGEGLANDWCWPQKKKVAIRIS